MRAFLIAAMLFLTLTTLQAQEGAIDKSITKTTVTYSTKDTVTLKMDIYSNEPITVKKPCIVFVFGGGFATGKRDAVNYYAYFNALAKHNFKVVSIDYRLGLQGGKKVSAFKTKPLKEAIDMAVTDLYDATAYLIQHSDQLGIDSAAIILSGTSAGAITALQADWEKRNERPIAQSLPENFQYKGVVAFAGAILSYKGAPTYKIPPAPTMLYHGTKDKTVPFNRIRFFNKILCGSNYLAYRFEVEKYPYYFRVMHRMGHEVASTPMHQHIDEVLWFLDEYVMKGKQYLVQVDFNDLATRRSAR